MVDNLQVAKYTHTTTDPAVAANDRTSGYAGTPGNYRMPADTHIMGNMHLVIDLHTILNNCVTEGTPVDSRVRTDFHVVPYAHPAKLWHLEPVTFIIGKTKAVAADNHPGMYCGACAYINRMTHRYLWSKCRCVTDTAAIANETASLQLNTGSDSDIILNNTMRTYPCRRIDSAVITDLCICMYFLA